MGINLIFYIIVGLVIGVLIAFIYKRSKKNRPTKGIKVDEANKNERIFKNLLKLNMKIRESLEEIELIQNIEEVIDQIRSLAPQINQQMPGSQIEWVINRMDTDYLPKLLNPYIRLEPNIRIEKKASFLTALKSIHDELKEVEEMLQNSDSEEFDSKAAFIKHRFSDLY